MALSRYVSVAVAVGVVASLSLLSQPAHVAEFWSPSIARAPIADPPAVPCNKQEWYNADRACLSWTAPRPDLRGQLLSMQSAPLLSH